MREWISTYRSELIFQHIEISDYYKIVLILDNIIC